MNTEIIPINPSSNNNAIQELSFEQALVMSNFYSKIVDSSLENIKQETISALGVRKLVETSQLAASIKHFKDTPDIIFELSNKGKQLLKEGKVEVAIHKDSGKFLPQIKNTEDGKIVELFKGKGTNLSTKAVRVSTIIVATAHMISAADLAKKLCIVDVKLDKLLSLRKSDLISKLESNYNLAREITASNELSNLDVMTLRDLHKENMFLRSAWRREVEYNISKISTPDESSWFDKTTTLQSSIDKKLCEEIKLLEGEMHLIEFSIIYDIVLTELAGHGIVFREKTLVAEIENLVSLKQNLDSKVKHIDSNKIIEEFNIKPILENMDHMIEKFQNFTPINSYNLPTAISA